MGGQVVDDQSLDAAKSQALDLQAQVQELVVGKQATLDKYLYSQITSGRLPNLSDAPSDEIAQSYVNILAENGEPKDVIPNDLTEKVREIATKKGEMLSCQK